MSKLIYLFLIVLSLRGVVHAAPFTRFITSVNNQGVSKEDYEEKLIKDVNDALNAIHLQSPTVHQDAIRIWSHFKKGRQPHYTYRAWARNIVEWLQENRQRVFNSQIKVAEVMSILKKRSFISEDAMVLLVVDVWGYLVHKEGIPDWNNVDPNEEVHKNPKKANESQI